MTESSEPRPDMSPGDEAPPAAAETAENVCPQCLGKGQDGGADCPACGGTGTVAEAVGGG
jgi:DnaJ-class molecular chaperone